MMLQTKHQSGLAGLGATELAAMPGINTSLLPTYLDTNGNAVSRSLCQEASNTNPWYCSFLWTSSCRCMPVGNITPGLPVDYSGAAATGAIADNPTGATEDVGTTGIGIPATLPDPLSSLAVNVSNAAGNAVVASIPWLWLIAGAFGFVLIAESIEGGRR